MIALRYQPVRRACWPEYPTRQEVLGEPRLLLWFNPPNWRGRQQRSRALGVSLGVTVSDETSMRLLDTGGVTHRQPAPWSEEEIVQFMKKHPADTAGDPIGPHSELTKGIETHIAEWVRESGFGLFLPERKAFDWRSVLKIKDDLGDEARDFIEWLQAEGAL